MNSEMIFGLVFVVICLLLMWGFIELLNWLCSICMPLRVLVQIIGVLCGISIIKHFLKDRDDKDW